MTKLRRSFTDEFKREAVALLASSGRVWQVRDDLDGVVDRILAWAASVKQAKAE